MDKERIEELMKRGFTVDEKDKVKHFNANYFAEYIRSQFRLIFGKDGFFYTYQGKLGIWQKLDEGSFVSAMRDILQKPLFGVWTLNREREYMAAIKRTLYYEWEMNTNKNLINLQNGMFDIETFELIPHSYEYYSTIQIPVEYNPDAECPRFRQFLEEIFEGDKEREAVCQEWAGYSLTTSTKAQKALILHGNGENGKGVFIDTLSLLIGKDNISNIPLNELNKGFSRVCLYNKIVNISSENEMDGKSFNTQYFKAIVGEDTITAEQKNKPVFSFKPTAKMLLTMNNLPDTKDTSHGYFRRLSILCFNASFTNKQRDNNLREKLQKELPGIFIWAIGGLKRLKENDFKFSECSNMNEVLRQYQREQTPMLQFFDECIVEEKDTTYRVENKVLYNAFKDWAYKNGLNQYSKISSQKFWREFEHIAKTKGYQCKAGRSNTLRYHTGVRIIGENKSTNIMTPTLGPINNVVDEDFFNN
ncbi:DNA primase family protein [Clostridium beijerinckii]|uniref:DNA primase family protein n=1 Tax=Clostridium beijerinckii TaxID=1520 RepID=UPI00098C5A62|nr:phage/plasmid primase, P4 family [Clostridium beijerinckii]NRT79271.1 putative DNA primase/helicase [Clostridium beijerinckii]OOM43827.1 hypothetical protein CBEIJ_38240 [Clostridium beijerinckii]